MDAALRDEVAALKKKKDSAVDDAADREAAIAPELAPEAEDHAVALGNAPAGTETPGTTTSRASPSRGGKQA